MKYDIDVLARKVALQEKKIEALRLALDYLEPLADEYYRRCDEEAGRSYA